MPRKKKQKQKRNPGRFANYQSLQVVLAVDCVGKQKISRRQSAVINGFAMMKISIGCSPLHKTVVRGIIADIRSADFISQKGILETGKNAPNVETRLKRRCMFRMGQTSITSRSLRILLSMNQRNVVSVEK